MTDEWLGTPVGARFASALVVLSAAVAKGQGLTVLGSLPGGFAASEASGVSADGSVVVGSSGAEPTMRAFRWTRVGGLEGLGALTAGGASQAYAVSADGAVVVGRAMTSSGWVAFRWDRAGGMQGLGVLAGSNASVATAVSADGSAIVGVSSAVSRFYAFRWSSGRMIDLGTLSGPNTWATGVSGDGQAVVGYSGGIDGCECPNHAFRWTPVHGMTDLGTLPGAYDSFASVMTGDGSIILGTSNPPTGLATFRWTPVTGMVGLGGQWIEPTGVSSDGSVIVGGGAPGPALWTAETGTVSLTAYLPTVGIEVAGWNLVLAGGVSADGKTLVGYGTRDGPNEALVIELPAHPCYANCDGSTSAPVLNVNDFVCFVNRFAAGDAYANCDYSTVPPVLNVQDFACFLSRFLSGCP